VGPCVVLLWACGRDTPREACRMAPDPVTSPWLTTFRWGGTSKGGSVTIAICDPRAPATWLRYKEEPNIIEPGHFITGTGMVNALEDLAIIAYRLHQWMQRLRDNGLDTSKLSIKISPHYPTHAYYKFDDSIYVYHYPYMQRGFHAPVYLFTNPQLPVHRFLNQCINSVVSDAAPINDVIDDIWKRYQAGLLSDRQVSKSEIVISSRP